MSLQPSDDTGLNRSVKASETRERVVVRMAGDSGDGMQLAGSRFTDATAIFGNDLATLPDFPAEIRAPAGTVAGVSAFQIHFASRDILTPGDTPDVLVAMNPAALKANLGLMRRGATILVNEDAFSVRAVQKAGYTVSPLDDGTLEGYTIKRIPMSSLTTRAVEAIDGATSRDAQKAKNLFALGVLSWLYDRPTDVTEKWIRGKFDGPVMEANLAAFHAGWSFGETSELIDVQVKVERNLEVEPGTYRNINGTEATALGLIAASVKSGLPLVYGAYPITPASDLLHSLARRQDMGVRTLQAEDEIAAASFALGAAFGGSLGVTCTSGPGPRPQDRDDRPGGDPRAADGDHRRPARGPVDRHADQDRAVRPAAGALRPPRRVAAAGPRRVLARPVLRGGLRGGADRDHLPHAGDPAVSDLFVANSSEPWKIPSAPDAAVDRPAPAHQLRRARTCPTPATTTWRGPGRSRARRVSRTASAGWRSSTARARSPTTARTTSG